MLPSHAVLPPASLAVHLLLLLLRAPLQATPKPLTIWRRIVRWNPREERAQAESPPMDFKGMIDLNCSLFPEVKGAWPSTFRPLPSGKTRQPDTRQTPGFTHAQPMQFSLDVASSTLHKASESPHPALARYPKCKFLRTWSAGMKWQVG